MKKIRIEHLEFRKYTSTKVKNLYEIISWSDNIYYGQEEHYRKLGYTYSFGGSFLELGDTSIDINFFKNNPETCYVIAWVKITSGDPWPYLETVGSRLIDLPKEDREIFWDVYERGNDYLIKKIKSKRK